VRPRLYRQLGAHGDFFLGLPLDICSQLCEHDHGAGLPPTQVIFFRDEQGRIPLLDWLDSLPDKARLKCLARLQRLEALGHELRRPEADYLRDGVYELRASYQGVHHRMLYFFHKTDAIVVSHGLQKEREVPATEINRAIERKRNMSVRPTSTLSPAGGSHGYKEVS